MSFSTTYKPLFELHIFHDYFLRIGKDAYDHTQIPDVFDSYNIQDFIKIVPKEETRRSLKNHKILLKLTETGLVGLIAEGEDKLPLIDSESVELEFLIYIKDTLFEKYTELPKGKLKMYVFKSANNAGKYKLDELDAVKASPTSEFSIQYSEEEDSKYQKQLEDIAIKDRVSLFGIVSLRMNELLNKGKIRFKAKKYKIVFESKKAVWVYLNSNDEEVYRTKKELPFIKKGTIKIRNKDSEIYRMATPSDIVIAGEAKIYV